MAPVAIADSPNQDNPSPPPPLNNIILPHVLNDDDRALEDFVVPLLDGLHTSILKPLITTNNFELKIIMFQMLQIVGTFNGLPNEDLNMHLMNFFGICDSYKKNGMSEEAVRLRSFPFYLSGYIR